jgi:hypothetical protein
MPTSSSTTRHAAGFDPRTTLARKPASSRATPVYLEVGAKRVFACSVEWPGWCRTAKDVDAALQKLADYAERYAPIAARAGARFPKSAADTFDVVERIKGNATTDFGAPGVVPELDREPVTRSRAARQAGLLEAAWAALDQTAVKAPESLRKGPRGGGRDRDKMVQHVLSAEAAYARKLGIRHREPQLGDDAAVTALRTELLDVLGRPSDGTPPVENGWPAAYGARRIVWHVLDHVWEIEDRSVPEED